MDVNYSHTDPPRSPDAFALGQFVAHITSTLGNKVVFFGETSFTAQPDAFAVEVERAILRYDYNDHLKISAGRYHTPINYWNTAYHHGLWLQTPIARPEMIRGGGTFQPVHFVGVLAEGNISSPTVGLGYNVGVGNGRGAVLSRAGDAGDVNRSRAWVAKLFSRPAGVPGLEFGGALYRDVVPLEETADGAERIVSGYVALAREMPEIIAEFTHVLHADHATGRDFNSHGFYVHAASRLPPWPKWKPYGRIELLRPDEDDPILKGTRTTVLTLGARYELSDFAAVKAEYRRQTHVDAPRSNGLYLQAAFTF